MDYILRESMIFNDHILQIHDQTIWKHSESWWINKLFAMDDQLKRWSVKDFPGFPRLVSTYSLA